jgi:hypothetical protein
MQVIIIYINLNQILARLSHACYKLADEGFYKYQAFVHELSLFSGKEGAYGYGRSGVSVGRRLKIKQPAFLLL